jgi:hypothetical protein
MSSAYVLSAVRVVRGAVLRVREPPCFKCYSSDIQEFVDAVERARGEETREFVWVRDTYSSESADSSGNEAADYCVRPQKITAALTRFERHYAKAADEYPWYYEAEATEIDTGVRYWSEVRPIVNGDVYKLRVGVNQCDLLLLSNPQDKRKRRTIGPGEYEWQSVTTSPTLVRVQVTRRSIVERFASILRDLRACASNAAQAKVQLLPETIL